jgi:hypothetical protein
MRVVPIFPNLVSVPLPDCRARVEIAMFETIERLQQEGLSLEEIALSLADAAEDYVMFLAKV